MRNETENIKANLDFPSHLIKGRHFTGRTIYDEPVVELTPRCSRDGVRRPRSALRGLRPRAGGDAMTTREQARIASLKASAGRHFATEERLSGGGEDNLHPDGCYHCGSTWHRSHCCKSEEADEFYGCLDREGSR